MVLGPPPDLGRPFTSDAEAYAGTFSGRGRGRAATVAIAASGRALTLTNTAAAGSPPEALTYRGGDTFGFKDTLVVFEKQDGKVVRLRVDSGAGYNPLARVTPAVP